MFNRAALLLKCSGSVGVALKTVTGLLSEPTDIKWIWGRAVKPLIIVGPLIATGMFLGATAASAEGEKDIPVRFEMQETDEGLVRLDTQTGIVSLCLHKIDQLICQPSIDGIKVYEDEITRLEAENSGLKQELSRISEVLAILAEDARIAAEETSTGLNLSGSSSQQEEGWIGAEEEKKLNDALEFTENAMRRFFGVVEDMKKDFQKDGSENKSD